MNAFSTIYQECATLVDPDMSQTNAGHPKQYFTQPINSRAISTSQLVTNNKTIIYTHRGHFFQPLPCPRSFHCLIISPIPSIAFLLSSNLPFNVLSHNLPLTFCPTPVPFTLNPFSILFRSISDGSFGDHGSKGSTLCWSASFMSSAWRRAL